MDSFERYISQTRLPEIGKSGQEKLLKSSVLIVGCGALGSPLAVYLAAAGAGKLVLADFDTVEMSNLHRQIFYTEEEIGKLKVECLSNRIKALNSEVEIETLQKFITPRILPSLSSEFDLIADAADNPATTFMLDTFCEAHGIPFSTAGVSEWKAQIFTYIPGSYSYGDIFSAPSENSEILPCSIAGIIGPVAGMAASVQAIESIKVLTGNAGENSRLLSIDFLTGNIQSF